MKHFFTFGLKVCLVVLFTGTSVLGQQANDPEQVVTGTVISADLGEPLPGVSILIKGTFTGTTTNSDGTYRINANSTDVLSFTFIGYQKYEVTVGNQSVIDVTLETDLSALEEVVVIGYGTQKRAEVTNAVSQLEGRELTRTPAISVSNALAGQIPGLFVTQTNSVPGFDDADIRVRGFSTFGSAPALIVIDGVATRDPDGINRLDPGDIESLTVLKDASAAIYGARSAGGVILVTTKRGESGEPRFEYSFNQGWSTPTIKPEVANAIQYMRVINSADELDGRALTFNDQQFQDFQSGVRNSTDWWDELLGDQILNQNRHSLNIRGGSEKIRYFASLGHARQGGLMRGDDKTKLRQYNARTNLDMQVHKYLNIGFDLHLRRKFTQAPQQGAGAIGPYVGVTSPLQPAYIDGNYDFPGEGWSQSNPAARITSPGYQRFTNDVLNSTLTWDLNIPWVEGLSVKGFAGFDKWNSYNKRFNYTWFYYEKDSEGNVVKRPSRTIEPVGLREDYEQTEQITFNARLDYARKFGVDHDLSAFIAYEQSENDFNFFWTERLGFESAEIDQLFAGSPDRSNWNNFGNASEEARQNYFGRISYGFKSRYLLMFNFRYDGSNIFPDGERFGFFPGVSAGWRISDEPFMPKNLFSELKLRVSWGVLGNDRVEPFQYLQTFSFDTDNGYVIDGQDVNVLVPGVAANPAITWEETENIDIGIEGSVLDGRLSFMVDFFKQKTSDILAPRNSSIPNTLGILSPDENIGEFENTGFEFQLSFRQEFASGLSINVTGNTTYARNKIVFLDEVPPAEGSEFQRLEGEPLGSTLVYKAIGIYRTQADLSDNVSYAGAGLGNLIFEDLNGDGVINGDDRYMYNTSANPELQYGINIGADFKGFDFSMLIQGQSLIQKRFTNGFNTSANGNGLAYVAENSYSLDNPDAELPRILATGIGAEDSDFWYRDAGFVRLKQMQLGYTLPESVLSSIGVDSFRIFVSGSNLLTFDGLGDFAFGDPEFRSANGAEFPQLKTVSLGLNVGF